MTPTIPAASVRRLKHFLLSFCLVCGFSILHGQDKLPYQAGELLIAYKSLAKNADEYVGTAIAREQRIFVDVLSANYDLDIKSWKALHKHLLNDMIEDYTTEKDQWEDLIGEYKLEGREFSNEDLKVIGDMDLARNLLLRINGEMDMQNLADRISSKQDQLRSQGFEIVDVSPNYLFYPTATPSDELFPFQEAHRVTNAEIAWDVERGDRQTVIAIIDSGVEIAHPDLAPNVVEGFDFVDLDTSFFEPWQLFPGEDYMDADSDPSDFDGHGTHVSGIAAARGFEEDGVIGVCPECSIMPLRAGYAILDEEDSTLVGPLSSSAIRSSIIFAVQEGADIINMSFGGDSPSIYVPELNNANAMGLVLIAAAGNNGDSDPVYPAFLNNVVAVANTTFDDRKAGSSSYGDWVDVSAPGSGILSTAPQNELNQGSQFTALTSGDREFSPRRMTFSGRTDLEGLTQELVFIGRATATDEADTNIDWDRLDGRIALIERGDISFQEKVNRAKQFGAVGAIIYNNQAGNFGGTLAVPQATPQIPVVSLSRAEGLSLLNEVDNDSEYTVTLIVTQLSNIHTYLTGTSMSSPYVAGMAGLILSSDPTLSNDEVKERIFTAIDSIDALNPAFAGQLGVGRVNLGKLFPTITSLDEEIGNDNPLVVFPNPNSGSITFRLDNDYTGDLNVEVWDLMGRSYLRRMQRKSNQNFSGEMDLSRLATGFYILRVQAGERLWVQRIQRL